jgi:hypothetical protein
MLRIIFYFCLSFSASAGTLVKEIISSDKSSIKEISYISQNVEAPLVIRDLPMFMGEQDYTSKEIYRETIYPNYLPHFYVDKDTQEEVEILGSEVRTLIKQGPDSNRIILTILGDGYTEEEKEKFFEDAQFMVDDLFVGVTFKSYIPFFNIYAVFTPSKESGITDRVKKNTAFGLYRSPVGSKRAIMPGSTMALEKALKLAPAAAHYPIVIANDEFYGGLGGRYAITSRSRVSGPIVLRHELGHNFSNVGEEYDGGQVYSGANFSRTGREWSHWRKNPASAERHEAKFVFGAYIWKELTKPFVQDFYTDETMALFSLKISSVGWAKEGDVEILLDGTPLKIDGDYTRDRSFFDSEPFAIKAGNHQLIIRSNGNNPEHVLAFANGYAFPADYDFYSGEVKAFNNFNESERMVGYRPTENSCLMRNMLLKTFCSVDQENIWLQFLMRVSLIDSFKKNSDGNAELKTIPFSESNLKISWYKNNQELVEFRGKKVVPDIGGLKVQVKLVTPEVRMNSEHFQDEVAL